MGKLHKQGWQRGPILFKINGPIYRFHLELGRLAITVERKWERRPVPRVREWGHR